jgi:hypothetical protein
MPNKPKRPMTSLVFPKSGPVFFKQFHLPDAKDDLEQAVIQRFVDLCQSHGEELTYAGRAPEPGDALLVTGDDTKIYLQLGEVVNVHRIRINEARARYGFEVWANTELQSLYRGVQVAMLDNGQMLDAPRPSSQEGRALLGELVEELRSLRTIIESLPANAEGQSKGLETFITLPTKSIRLNIRLLRHAVATVDSPGKWLWTGNVPVDGNESLLSFQEVLRRKSRHYGQIANPFWLLLYSLDCSCDEFEQASLADSLVTQDHPFDKVTIFIPNAIRGDLKQVFPRPDNLPDSSKIRRKNVLAQIRPEDMVPKWDDPRWKVIGCHGDEDALYSNP